MEMKVWNNKENCFVDDMDMLMGSAGLDPRMKFEAIGIQDDETPVVFDKCGSFGYLDCNIYSVVIDIRTNP